MGPFLDYLPDPETSATYLYLNTNKKSITRHHLGGGDFEDGLQADVVVETRGPWRSGGWGMRCWRRSIRG